MRNILLIYQNNEAWNGLGQGIIDVATPDRAEEMAARCPDAQHWGIEIRARMHSRGEGD